MFICVLCVLTLVVDQIAGGVMPFAPTTPDPSTPPSERGSLSRAEEQQFSASQTDSGVLRFTRKSRSAEVPPESTTKPIHPKGNHFARKAVQKERLLSGKPDPWFQRILNTEPENLTLDEVEDMTDEELIDYVAQFHWNLKRSHTNIINLLLRREAIVQKKRQRRPGDAHEEYVPLWDAHDSDQIGESNLQSERPDVSGAVAPEDRLMSHPRWHLTKADEQIAADPYYNRRRSASTRRSAAYHEALGKARISASQKLGPSKSGGTTNPTAESGNTKPTVLKKSAVIPTVDFESLNKIKQNDDAPMYQPKRVTSTVHRKSIMESTTRDQRRARREKLKSLPKEKRLEMAHSQDPGRCYMAATKFCNGLQHDFAFFVNCTLSHLDKFEDHDEHCRKDFRAFYGPCRADFVTHCAHLNSFDTMDCLFELAKLDASIIEKNGVAKTKVTLSMECLGSELLESAMELPDHARTAELTDAERKIIYKYQEFWLSQQKENLDESTLNDYAEADFVIVDVREEHEDPVVHSDDAFDLDDDF